MADPYFDKPEREKLKEGLYAYLKDKAKRRASVTGSDAYSKMQDQFAEQDGRYATGALLGGLSEAASMAGTVGGKRAESNIIPKMNEDLYKARQGNFENLKSLRNMEESSNMNDLQVARYLTNLDQYDDQNKRADETHASNMETGGLNRDMLRKRLREKYDIDPRVEAPGGVPVQFDEVGNPRTLPGYKLRDTNKSAAANKWQIISGAQGADGELIERNPVTSETRVVKMPPGVSVQGKGAYDVAKNFETDYAKKMQIASFIEREAAKFDELIKAGDIEGAVKHGEGTLKDLNSAFGPDAVGVEETKRLGGFLRMFQAPWEAGSMIGRDLEKFSEQLRNKSQVIKEAGKDSYNKSQLVRRQGLKSLDSNEKQKINPEINKGKTVDEMTDEEVDAALRSMGKIK